MAESAVMAEAAMAEITGGVVSAAGVVGGVATAGVAEVAGIAGVTEFVDEVAEFPTPAAGVEETVGTAGNVLEAVGIVVEEAAGAAGTVETDATVGSLGGKLEWEAFSAGSNFFDLAVSAGSKPLPRACSNSILFKRLLVFKSTTPLMGRWYFVCRRFTDVWVSAPKYPVTIRLG